MRPLFILAALAFPLFPNPSSAQTFAQWQRSAEADLYDPNSPASMLAAGVFEGIWWGSLRPIDIVGGSPTGVCVNENSQNLPSVPARVLAVVEEGGSNPALPLPVVVLRVMRKWYPCN
jgi:hypothetical protein